MNLDDRQEELGRRALPPSCDGPLSSTGLTGG